MSNHVPTGLSLDYYENAFRKTSLTDDEKSIVKELNRLSRMNKHDEYRMYLELFPGYKTLFQYLDDKKYFVRTVLDVYRNQHYYNYSYKKILEVDEKYGWSCNHWSIWAVLIFCGNFHNIEMNDLKTWEHYNQTIWPMGVKYSMPIFCNYLPDHYHQSVAIFLQTSFRSPSEKRNFNNYVIVEPQGLHIQNPGEGTALPIPGRAIIHLPDKLYIEEGYQLNIGEHLILQKFKINSVSNIMPYD